MKNKTFTCKICGREVQRNKNSGNMGSVCNSCRQKYRQVKMKSKAIEYKGGKCEQCGYDKNKDVLEFHHKNPQEKEFSISAKFNRSWESIKEELDKCVMLCANCHREIHSAEHRQTTVEEYEKWINPISEKVLKKRKVTALKQKALRDSRDKKIEERKDKIINSNIDFSRYGWAKQLEQVLGIKSAAIVRWIKKHMLVFYKENCYREKNIDNDDIAKILQLYQEYPNAAYVAKQMGIDAGRVSLVLRDNGIVQQIANAKKVAMIDIETGVTLNVFSSIQEAGVYCEDKVKTTRSKNPSMNNIAKKISNCINGHQNTAYGYKWICV